MRLREFDSRLFPDDTMLNRQLSTSTIDTRHVTLAQAGVTCAIVSYPQLRWRTADLDVELSQFLIGDYIVLWRAYLIYGRPRWLLILVAVLGVTFTGE